MSKLLTVEIEFEITHSVKSTEEPVSASVRRSRKFPMDIFSEFRKCVLDILNDNKKYRIYAMHPSDVSGDDSKFLYDLLEGRDIFYTDNDDDMEKLQEYLKSSPVSKSFYVIVDVLNGKQRSIPIAVYVRISDHIDSSFLKNWDLTKEGIVTEFGEKYSKVELVPVMTLLRKVSLQEVKETGEHSNKELSSEDYQLDCVDLLDLKEYSKPFGSSDFDDIKHRLREYFDAVWETITKTQPIKSAVYASYSCSNIDHVSRLILKDLENNINDLDSGILRKDFIPIFQNYHWVCDYATVDDENYIVEVSVSDNRGNTTIVSCDIYIDDYFDDELYHNEIVTDFCVSLFEQYESFARRMKKFGGR